eukprot:TRINITY_DN5528_c0_g1_i1.p1 TRINITY_DN5528_c0_g1~~TRINITY_DN5528_c0_g1_i1.p1  ORF type:complete len:151 (+),score=26.29 TRINITY_DN5528_c0_g1_i1:27-455(+)
MFGLNPAVITERKSKYTYGVQVAKFFIEGQHREDYRFEHGGETRCFNCWSPYIQKGQAVEINDNITDYFAPLYKEYGSVGVTLFSSTEKDPKYTTDGGSKKLDESYYFVAGGGRKASLCEYEIRGHRNFCDCEKSGDGSERE